MVRECTKAWLVKMATRRSRRGKTTSLLKALEEDSFVEENPKHNKDECPGSPLNESDSSIEYTDEEETEEGGEELSNDDGNDNSSGNEKDQLKDDSSSPKTTPTDITSSSIQPEGAIDNYFSEQRKKPKHGVCKTLPKMDRKTMNQVLANAPDPFHTSTQALHDVYRALHKYWLVQLGQGFNILLYGYGSKHTVIEQFCHNQLTNEYHLVVNGFFPGLSLKQILNEITSEVLEHSGTFKNHVSQCNFICRSLCGEEGDAPGDLFLIIHNIDGVALRDEKTQFALSLLSTCPKVHIIASVDHINSSLLWDEIVLARYNWIWHDVTTFERYTMETSYENSLLIHQSSSLELTSLTSVLKSVPEKTHKMFELLATYHLEHKTDPTYNGVPFRELYRMCREKFLAASDVTLRAQLTEFFDHKLVKSRKIANGTETLTLLVQDSILEQVV